MVKLVRESLRESQRMSGRDDDFTVTEATVPIGDLVDFDSLNGIEATQVLEERLGGPLPENLFTDETTRRPLSVGLVVDRLLGLASSEEET
jgi:hypothetical protein